MKKKLTVYCIKYGKSSTAFIAIADNSIPLKIIRWYADVDNSFIYESFVKINMLPLMKKISKDTNKTAILYHNHKSIKEFISEVIGNEVTWIDYNFSIWTKVFIGLEEYSIENGNIIEIDHPIKIKDKVLNSIINEGLKLVEKKQKELNEKIAKIRKRRKKDYER